MPINPSSPADTYPTHIDTLGHGGFMAVRTKAIRDNITIQRRKEGMLVYVLETDSLYQLRGPVTGNNWVQFKLMASAVNTINTGTSGNDVNSAISPDGNTLTLNIPDASPTARGVVTTATQTFGGNKIFNSGVTVDGVGSSSYKGKLKLGINSSMASPGFGGFANEGPVERTARRNSKYLVVNDQGEVTLAPFVNRYVTIQKRMNLSHLWTSTSTNQSLPIDIGPGETRLLFVNFIAELQAQFGLTYWGTNLSITVTNAPMNEFANLNGGGEFLTDINMPNFTRGIVMPYIDIVPWFSNDFVGQFPIFFLNFYNTSTTHTLRITPGLEIIVSVTFDLLDPHIDGIPIDTGGEEF